MFRTLLAASAVSILLTTAASADAQDRDWVPKAQGSRIGVDFDWWPTDNRTPVGTYSSHSLTWDLVGQIQLHRVVFLDFDVPWAVWDRGTSSNRDGTFVFGNPTVGAHWSDTFHNRIAVFAGGALSVSTLVTNEPGAFFNRGNLYLTRSMASATRAYADLHRFVPDHFFIRTFVGIELRILPVLFYRAELVPILAIPISDYGNDTDAFLEIHNEIEARARIGVGGGMHLQAVFFTDDLNTRNDAAQLAMEPYFVYEPVRGFYARVGVLVAVDQELGFGLNQGKVASIRVALGGKW